MNDVLKVIHSRRSIRLFKEERIKRDELDAIVEAGLCAPSANNSQDRHFTVIQDKIMIVQVNGWILNEIEQSGISNLQEIAKRSGELFFRNAPTVIIVSSDGKDRFGIINAAAATENILLAAESLGIGSCWIGMVGILAGSSDLKLYAHDLQLPNGYAPQIGITLGYIAAEKPPAPLRKEDLVSYIV
jgi:nitroreductase